MLVRLPWIDEAIYRTVRWLLRNNYRPHKIDGPAQYNDKQPSASLPFLSRTVKRRVGGHNLDRLDSHIEEPRIGLLEGGQALTFGQSCCVGATVACCGGAVLNTLVVAVKEEGSTETKDS